MAPLLAGAAAVPAHLQEVLVPPAAILPQVVAVAVAAVILPQAVTAHRAPRQAIRVVSMLFRINTCQEIMMKNIKPPTKGYPTRTNSSNFVVRNAVKGRTVIALTLHGMTHKSFAF